MSDKDLRTVPVGGITEKGITSDKENVNMENKETREKELEYEDFYSSNNLEIKHVVFIRGVDGKVVSQIKDSIRYHKGIVDEHSFWVKKYTKALVALEGGSNGSEVDNPRKTSSIFNNRIESLFRKQDTFLTAKSLMLCFMDEYNRNITYSSFSGQLSLAISSNPDIFIKITFNDNPMVNRFYYGLKEWLDGGEIKPEYSIKINNHEQKL